MKHPLVRSLAGMVMLIAGAGQGFAATLPAPATGASVDETRVTKTFLVDPANADAADNDKHGTPDAPFATLRYACEAAAKAKDANVGVKIILAPGTYREAAEIRAPAGGKPDTDAPLILEAAERDQATVDGADTEGWTPSTWKTENGRWTHVWPFTRSGVPRPAPGLPANATGAAYRRGDLVFVNGVPLRQVSALAELAPGSFWGVVVRAPSDKGHGAFSASVIVQPPEETELDGAIVQVSTRPHGLTITGRRNVVVRGLMCQHAASPGGGGGPDDTAGLLLKGCSNVLVEDVLSQWNDGAGLVVLEGANVTLRRVRLLHNGGSGLAVWGVKNLLTEDCEASFNNFRGEWAGWIDPRVSAAVKAEGVQGSTWRRTHAVGNACRALWWSGDDTDLTVEDAVVGDNLVSGLCVENSPGPVRIRRCLVTGTKGHPSLREGAAPLAGISLAATPDVTLESCVAAGNAGTQFALWDAGGKGSLRAERHAYRHNVFGGNDAAQTVCVLPPVERTGKPDVSFYYDTLETDENCYWNPVLTEAFAFSNRGDKANLHSPGGGVSLADWRAILAARDPKSPEGKSLWQDPQFADPADGDYRIKAAAPLTEWDLPADDASANQ